jgi:lysophospholipase L1-like esterase
MTKVILCFGDSNTWGYNPGIGTRFGPETRWPGVLKAELGEGYSVIEEGLNARTTVFTDPVEGALIDRNGKNHLAPLLESHRPIDLLIVMLGLNDLKRRFGVGSYEIAQGAGELVRLAQCSRAGPDASPPQVLLVAPAAVKKLDYLAELFDGAIQKSTTFSRDYLVIAEKLGCRFFDAGSVVGYSDLDGIHLSAESHRQLGRALAGNVRSAIGSSD